MRRFVSDRKVRNSQLRETANMQGFWLLFKSWTLALYNAFVSFRALEMKEAPRTVGLSGDQNGSLFDSVSGKPGS